MIDYIKGDLLDFPSGINVIAHCANCQATMGAGIALQIKDKYPKAYKTDVKYHDECIGGNKTQLGTYSASIIDTSGKIVVNLYGQDRYATEKRQLNYEAIYCAMESLRDAMVKNNHKKYVVGFPFLMGCRLAGGSWAIVEAMIHDIFAYAPNIKVYIVKYNK